MPEPNFENRTLYHGDNLDFLRGMNSETVHLIATDPPFNKNRDFHATPDSLARGAQFADRWSWDRDVHEEWVDAIEDNWPGVWAVIQAARTSFGDDMGAFLCWLGVRLLEMHRVLRDDGSIYLHIDHTAHAYVKALMDAIWGKSNFRNEIVWCYTGPSNTRRWFPRKHDTILFYAKSDTAGFRRDAVRIPYNEETLARRGRVEGAKSVISPSVENAGRRSDDEVEERFGEGKVPEDWWTGIAALTNQRENTRFPTQKPLALYERIIQASSNPGNIVLDPFCGCATTPIAAERLGRQWVGIDIWDGAHKMVLDRLEAEGLAVPEAADIQQGQQILTFNHITYSQSPPPRTDADEIAVPNLRLRIQRPKEPWERLTNREIRVVLEKAQEVDALIGCAGCGRTLEGEFMELDHITPKADAGPDHLLNRILLCRPCNGRKSNQLTMSGLRRQNNQAGWMMNSVLASDIQDRALLRASLVRDNWPAHEYR